MKSMTISYVYRNNKDTIHCIEKLICDVPVSIVETVAMKEALKATA